MPYVFLDTETTGLNPVEDDVLEIAIVHEVHSEVLLNTLVSPRESRKSWPEAQAIHGITPEMVQDSPSLNELEAKIQQIVEGNDVVVYNKEFHAEFLSGRYLQPAASIQCSMIRYSKQYGEWSEYHGNHRWQSLVSAARHTGYKLDGTVNRALAGAKACRHVWLWLEERGNRKYTTVEYDGSWAGKIALSSGDVVEIYSDSDGRGTSGVVKIPLKKPDGLQQKLVYTWNMYYFRVGLENDSLARYDYSYPSEILRRLQELEEFHPCGVAEDVYAEVLTFMPHRSEWERWERRWREQFLPPNQNNPL